jgi:hypothetical protein
MICSGDVHGGMSICTAGKKNDKSILVTARPAMYLPRITDLTIQNGSWLRISIGDAVLRITTCK